MKIAHLRRGLHVSPTPRSRQMAPVAVITGAYIQNDEIAVADNPVGCKTPVRSGVRTRADNVRALRPFAAHRRHDLPCHGEHFTLLHARTQEFERTIERRLGDRIGDLEANNVVLSFDFLRAHEHALVAIGEFSLWKNFSDGVLHVDIPDVDAHPVPRYRTYQAFNLFGPSLHSDFFPEIRARTDLIRAKPRHAGTAMFMIHRPENRIMVPSKHGDGVPHNKSGPEMMTVAHQITRIFSAENEQRI